APTSAGGPGSTPETPRDNAVIDKRDRVQGSEDLQAGWKGYLKDEDELVIAVIDDFAPETDEANTAPDGSHFNHGKTIEHIIREGGAAANGSVSSEEPLQIRTITYNVDNPGQQRVDGIRLALEDVLARVKAGEPIDAVNISQQALSDFDGSEEVDQILRTLQDDYGVPVVVAAGNGGPGASNRLAREAAIVVENSEYGKETRASSSSAGNVRSEGAFTSQATANAVVRAAQFQDMGMTPPQILQFLLAEARLEGGSLDAAANQPVFDPA
ncbi:MAG: hypothetical protein AB1758_07785, partial [Candidatus Eremiobacterota bacterium]